MPKSCMVVPLLLQELEKELEKAHDVTFQHSPTLQQLSADLGTLCTCRMLYGTRVRVSVLRGTLVHDVIVSKFDMSTVYRSSGQVQGGE